MTYCRPTNRRPGVAMVRAERVIAGAPSWQFQMLSWRGGALANRPATHGMGVEHPTSNIQRSTSHGGGAAGTVVRAGLETYIYGIHLIMPAGRRKVSGCG